MKKEDLKKDFRDQIQKLTEEKSQLEIDAKKK